MATEIGATAGWAQFNVKLAAGMLREAASLTTQITGEIIPSDKPGCVSMAVRQPVGVVLGIAPWNAPVILGVRAIATPLACGNTVVLKASEICPGTHRLIGAVLREAGIACGRRQRDHQCARGCRRDHRVPDRASGRAPDQLHRLDTGRPHHRGNRGPLPEAGASRARRQGAPSWSSTMPISMRPSRPPPSAPS